MDYIKVVEQNLPDVSDARIHYEGSKIVVYTRNLNFFLTGEDKIRGIVDQIKKRIEVRIEPDTLPSTDDTIKKIKEIIPKDAGIEDISFEPDFSKVIISVRQPQIAVGESGETVKEIKKETLWIPFVQRVASPKSVPVEAIRKVLYESSKFRKKFLNDVGKQIYSAENKDTKWGRVSCLGGSREVGRSCFLLQTPNSKILMDCGLSTGATGEDQYPIFLSGEFDINSLDAIILSHAHLDHCGFIPYLYKMGFNGPLYCTTPTRELAALLQMDTIDIMQKDMGKSLYTSTDIKNMIKHTIPLKYKEITDITSDIRLIFENAGHLLGSAITHLNISNGKRNLIYTGDIKYSVSNLLDPAFTQFMRCECLIMESTYGGPNDLTPRLEDAEKDLVYAVEETAKRGGKVLIPSFAVGRGQEIMIILDKYGIDLPVYIDGMIWDASSIHSTYPKYLSYKLQRQIIEENKNPFESDKFIHVASRKERDQVIADQKPFVVLATSGMVNGGPIMEYIKKFGSDPKNTLVFVGYQAEGTIGRKIQRGDKVIETPDGEQVEINLQIKTIDGLSGHSDRKQLLNYIGHLKEKPQRLVVAHGEMSKCVNFADAAGKIFGIDAIAPWNLETFRFL
ncbi:MAG: beta-CASP ribonuclease aCPSF1 [Candidatus Aenigmarchaeota archaeon]|nr:beta-CASP ribonuclease aCPSF1 [Candidatus Aenigmarchaeota archaeon]